MCEGIWQSCLRDPCAHPGVYYDELQIAAYGKPKQLRKDIAKAADTLKQMIGVALKCTLPQEKAAVAAPDRSTAAGIRERRGPGWRLSDSARAILGHRQHFGEMPRHHHEGEEGNGA